VGVRVVKVGGSLFDYDGLVAALRDWLSSQKPANTVLLWGGGPFVDAVRALARRFPLDDLETHWLAIRLLDTTARLGKLLLPESRFCDRFEVLRRWLEDDSELLITFSPEHFLQHVEPKMGAPGLPCSWDVTSDSIAARLAEILRAEELVLLKSADPQPPITPRHLAEIGYVDRHFPYAAKRLQNIRFVNLRNGCQYPACLAETA
jgi:aspartokinase-like uncharacterized kinase